MCPSVGNRMYLNKKKSTQVHWSYQFVASYGTVSKHTHSTSVLEMGMFNLQIFDDADTVYLKEC